MSRLDSCLDLLLGEAHLTEGEEKLPNSLQNEGTLEEEKRTMNILLLVSNEVALLCF